MYVCICKAVTDSAIRQAVREGARSLRDLSAKTGCSTQCGRCSDLATEILEDELATMGASAGARPPVRLRVVSNS
jgi:bacterioferritin-associated ferredoxin